ncbi:MAG: ester cyclase [Amaricoccus sp.]
MSERNKAQMRRVIEEVYNRGDLALVDELATADMVIHAASGDIVGREAIKAYVAALRGGFSDLHVTIEEQIAEGNRVVTRWTARGTHDGPFQGLAPTGRRARVTGTDVDRLVDGRAVECWMQMDELGLMQQLGAVAAA